MNLVDRVALAVNPEAAVRRAVARERHRMMATFRTSGASSDTSYDGASAVRRTMRRWFPSLNRNPDYEVIPERTNLLARSRDAYRNQPIARGAINTYGVSVIGSGLELHCQIDREFLGFEDPEEAAKWERNTERLWRAWAYSTDADARRRNTFYKLQTIAYRSAKRDGEIFALLPLIPRSGTICDLRVQLVEADRVSTPDTKLDAQAFGDGSIWDGIETGKWGEPVAYHIETTTPGPSETVRTWSRVLAFGSKSGRQQVIHYFDEDRPGQRRGLPFLAPILEHLKQISRYSEAELMAAVISGMFTVFIKKADSGTDILAGLGGGTEDGDEGPGIELGNGAIVDLNEGESIETANPGRPNQQFGPFVAEVIKQIGMGLNIPYEVLTKQFNSSYSASRAAIMQAWEVFLVEREWFIQAFLQPIYTEWLSQMIASGRIEAPGFFDSVEVQRAYTGSSWYGPVPLQIDPVKEAAAAEKRMAIGVSTLAEETVRMGGGDWETNAAQRAREKDRYQQLGLTPDPAASTDPIPIYAEPT